LDYHGRVKTTPALALLLGAALATACSHGPVAARRTLSPADYFPLSVGNTWVYVDRSPQLPAGQAEQRRTVRVVSRDAEGYFHDNERGELRTDPDCLHDRMRRLLCAPFEVGRGWSSVVSVTSTERYEIAAADELVRTPAGTFPHCVKVRARNKAGPGAEAVLESTYAPGVGLVRIETFVVVKGEATPQIRAELESYKVAGAGSDKGRAAGGGNEVP
jgi:hypothetical protein